ncbi:MAG: YceI family protein [Mucilaginibacter polytrichastri]|nr:YceI family protein [Mucilaginibacter polytrichastri]
MRLLLLSFLLCLMPAQTEWATAAGNITLFAEAPFGDINAISEKAQCSLSGKIVSVSVPVSSFIFSKPMMQDHFNARYLESDKFPRAVFRGEIGSGFDPAKEGTQDVRVSGKLRVHGVTRDRVINGKIEVKKDRLVLTADFDVNSADHKIEVPQIVGTNVCEKIRVRIEAELTENKKAL